MYKMVDDYISGNTGYVGIEPGVLYDLNGGTTTTTRTSPSPLTLPNSAGKSLKLSLAGASEQDSTTGAQLIDMSAENWEHGGLNGSTGINEMNQNATRLRIKAGNMISVKPSTTYTISRYNLDYCVAIRFYKPDGTFAGETQGAKKINGWILPPNANTLNFTVTTNGNVAYARMLIGKGDSTQNVSLSDLGNIKIQLQEGFTAKPWESYTGGKPSPSPEHQQPIKNAGLRTKNICMTNFAEWESGQYVASTGKIGSDATRVRLPNLMKLNNQNLYFDTGSKDYLFIVRTYTGTDTSTFVRNVGPVENKRTLSFADQEKYISITLYSPVIANMTKDSYRKLFMDGTIKPLIYSASEANKSYEPYGYKADVRITDGAGQLQTATIYTEEPLRGINGYRDTISQKDGIWGAERKIIEYAFNGTESWTIADILGYKVASISVNKSISQYTVSNMRCSHAKALTWNNAGVVCFVDNYTQFRFGGAGVEQVQTLATWKSWLADQANKGTPLTIIYTLATTVWAPLDDATQAALNALTAYKGTTVIEVDSGDVPVQITATYKKKGR